MVTTGKVPACIAPVEFTLNRYSIRTLSEMLQRDYSNKTKAFAVFPDGPVSSKQGRIGIVQPIIGSRSWRIYIINADTCKFENLGPRNGAVLEIYDQGRWTGSAWHETTTVLNIRVDDDGKFPPAIAAQMVNFKIPHDDLHVIFHIRLTQYQDFVADGDKPKRSWTNKRVGITPMNNPEQQPLMLSASKWMKILPKGTEIDFNNKEFPAEPHVIMEMLHARG